MESSFVNLFLATILAYGPAYLANMAPPLAKGFRLPGEAPIAPRLLGTHKTYRGFAVGMVGGMVGAALLHLLQWQWFGAASWGATLGAGALIGLMAMTGDALKSGVKRAVGVKAGQPFVPWDQIDFILGASLVMVPLGIVDWTMVAVALIVTPLLHLIVNIGAYLLGLKDVWW